MIQIPTTEPDAPRVKTEEGQILVIQGEFVVLRPIAESDAEQTFQWRQSRRAALLNSGAQSVDQQRKWILSRPMSEINWIIEAKIGEALVPVGMISLVDIDLKHRRAESARFLIGEEGLVKGLPVAVEAMKLLYQVAFDELKLVRLYGSIASDNHLMIKWQKYLGMKEEGRLRSHYYIQDHFQDAICLGLSEDEYRKVSLPRMNALISAGRKKPSELV